ncbi:hypothetical protein ACTXT7_005146 [Hymenolepis weldensis]
MSRNYVINDFRESLLRLFLMDKVCVPLVYTQVVTLAVYSYFLSSIIGRQFIVNSSINSKPFRKDYYIPLYTILEFIVYMGWLKLHGHSRSSAQICLRPEVAETLVNPMGEDDEDFDINAIIDSNWSYGMHMVDKKHHPTELVKDKFWNSANVSLPHTTDSRKLQSTQMIGSVFNIKRFFDKIHKKEKAEVSVTEPHEKPSNAISMANIRSSMELDNLEVPAESLGSRFKLFDSMDQHNLSTDQLPIPQSSQASIIQPQVPTSGDAGLPALAEEDEDNTSQQEEDEEAVEFEQTQADEPHGQLKQEDELQQELQSKEQVEEENVQPIPILKAKEIKKNFSNE